MRRKPRRRRYLGGIPRSVLSSIMRTLGRRGGRARADRLSPERRREIATLGSHAAAEKRRERAARGIVIALAGALTIEPMNGSHWRVVAATNQTLATEITDPRLAPDHLPDTSIQFVAITAASMAVSGSAYLSTGTNDHYAAQVAVYWTWVSTGVTPSGDVLSRLLTLFAPKPIQEQRQEIAQQSQPPNVVPHRSES